MYLAQVNVSEILYPTTDPRFLKFSAGAKLINKKVKEAPGFICGEQVYDNDVLFITRSVWDSAESLVSFVYSGTHKKFMDMSSIWFKESGEPKIALWYQDESSMPSVEVALKKLSKLRLEGETDEIMGVQWLSNFA